MGVCGMQVIREGDCCTYPKEGQTVIVHYEGKLEDGHMFDSSKSRNLPFRFVLGKHQVIKGWEETLKKMSIGEIVLLTCPPEYGYGKQGYPGVIPPNATLIFEIELIGIQV